MNSLNPSVTMLPSDFAAERDSEPAPLSSILYSHHLTSAASDDEARVERIAEEAEQAFRALGDVTRAVAVFGSAREAPAGRWGELARETAELLVREGFAVITGGGPGLMEAANEGAERAGGDSIGLTIELPHEQGTNPYVTRPVPFHYFFLRKLAFVKYACAFICFPGGYGTLDELFEALNLKLTQRLDPFPILLVGSEYWSGLVEWLRDNAVGEGALSLEDLGALEVLDDPVEVVDRVRACHTELCRRLGIE